MPSREKKMPRGRPRFPEGEARSVRVVVHVRPEDAETLERMAAERCVEVGAVARELLERSLARRK